MSSRDDDDEPYEPVFSFVETASGKDLFIVHAVPEDPMQLGRVLANCVRTFAGAYAGLESHPDDKAYQQAMAGIVNGFNAELINPSSGELRVLYGPEVSLPDEVDDVTESESAANMLSMLMTHQKGEA